MTTRCATWSECSCHERLLCLCLLSWLLAHDTVVTSLRHKPLSRTWSHAPPGPLCPWSAPRGHQHPMCGQHLGLPGSLWSLSVSWLSLCSLLTISLLRTTLGWTLINIPSASAVGAAHRPLAIGSRAPVLRPHWLVMRGRVWECQAQCDHWPQPSPGLGYQGATALWEIKCDQAEFTFRG